MYFIAFFHFVTSQKYREFFVTYRRGFYEQCLNYLKPIYIKKNVNSQRISPHSNSPKR